MHCTSLGKSVLAFWPVHKTRAVLMHHGMSRQTARTIVALSTMERELARIRRQGYAVDDVEFEEDVRCVGAPIFDHRGTPIAAISVSAPISRMPLARAHQVGAMVRGGAAGISRAMGWEAGAGQIPGTVIPVHSGESLAGRPMNLRRPPDLKRRPERTPATQRR